MTTRSVARTAGFLLIFLGLAGCKSPESSGGLGATSALAPPTVSMGTLTSIGQTVGGAVESAGESVANALQIEVPTQRAPDPTRLDHAPEQINPRLRVLTAGISEQHGNAAQAAQQFERALQVNPQDTTILVAYARFADRMGNTPHAEQLYDRAWRADPSKALVWNDIAIFRSRHGQLDGAIEAGRKAVSIDPSNARYRNNLASLLIEQNRVDEAVAQLRAVHPEAVACCNAACFLANRDPQRASHLVARALQLDPSLPAARTMAADLARMARPVAHANSSNAAQPLIRSSAYRP